MDASQAATPELKLHVQRCIRHKWLATRGIDEKSLLGAFPTELQREIKRQLCLNIVQQLPVFDHMDELTLDVICERLEPALYTKGMYLIREGDPVTEIFFIIRGYVDSCTTDGGRSGFFSSSQITAGGFCGEELLMWFLDQHPTDSLRSSIRTVKPLSDVETFCLSADNMKFIVLQFPTLRTTKLRHKFKFCSQQWQTWAACYIQAAWRRYRSRKELVITSVSEYSSVDSADEEDHDMDIFVPRPDAGIEVYQLG